MIKICEDYANEHSIKFNGNKSKYLVFGNYVYNPTIKVNNEIVSRCDSAMHLGHMLYTVNTSKELTEQAVNDFKKSYYSFISRFDTCHTTSKINYFISIVVPCMDHSSGIWQAPKWIRCTLSGEKHTDKY